MATAEQTERMNVVRLEVSNFKGVEYAVLPLDEYTTVIGGKNHQGKTSAIDALLVAIAGKKAFPKDPIREGEIEAEIVVHLEGATELLPWPCTVTRTITRSDDGESFTTRVMIQADDGQKAPSPQTLLASLRDGDTSYDPLGFVRLKPKEQVDALKELVGLDLSELEGQYRAAYDTRTDVKRAVRDLEGQIKEKPIDSHLPNEPIDVAGLMDDLATCREHNEQISRRLAAREQCRHDIANLQATIEEAQTTIDALANDMAVHVEYLNANDPMPTADLEKNIRESGEINSRISENQRRLQLMEEKASKRQEVKRLDQELKKLDLEKQNRMKQVQWPIDGLAFGNDGVVYEGRPFGDLSSSEQLEVAVAIDLRRNPKFPLSIVRDGSLLDDDTLTELSAIVQKLGGQCLVERVSTGPECQFIFSNGRATANGRG